MNIYELQDNEHQKILHLLQLVLDAKKREEVGDLFNRFRVELSAHKIAEEQTLFKYLQDKNPQFQSSIENIKTEHVKLEELLGHLRRDHDLEWEDLDQGLRQIQTVLQNDIKGEEELLTACKDFLSAEEADILAREMSASKLEFEKRLVERLTT
jgi:hemerythrin superfamily protein